MHLFFLESSDTVLQNNWGLVVSFALISLLSIEYAAAFFLLADKLKDAVNVILKNLKDYQLAIAICRVYEGDSSPLLKEILQNTVLPQAIESKDRWLISISYWLLDDPKEAVRSLIVSLPIPCIKLAGFLEQ